MPKVWGLSINFMPVVKIVAMAHITVGTNHDTRAAVYVETLRR